MQTKTLTTYSYDELSREAQEKAREWYTTDLELDSDCVIADFVEVCALMGVGIDTSPVRLMRGGSRQEPCVYWGDGARFDASYRHRIGAVKAVKAHAPNETELHRIARSLQDLQKRHFYQLRGTVCQSGRYCHADTMGAGLVDYRTDEDMPDDVTEHFLELMRDLARWLYKQLERHWEYQFDAETVAENIRINDYQFNENGDIA